MDANAGSHEKAFATNFNPEINIREVTQAVRHFEHGKWVETPAILDKEAVHFTFDYPVAGCKESYLLYHEEMESLARNLPGLAHALLDDVLRKLPDAPARYPQYWPR